MTILKLKYLFFILCLTIGFFGFSQNYQVLYKVDFHPKKENTDLKTEYMRLETSGSKSIFYNFSNKEDSIAGLKENRVPYLRFTVIQEDKRYSYYGNFNDLYYVFNEPLKTGWTVNNKTSDFSGYKVQEARIELDGRKWTALFSPEIPISAGPYKFSGLPGLILKVYSEDGDYSFEMIELIKSTSSGYADTFSKTKYVKISKKKADAFIFNFLKDPGSQNFKLVNTSGDQFDYKFSGSRGASYKDMNNYLKGVIKKYNNPIDGKIYILIF